MDFMNRGNRPVQQNTQTAEEGPVAKSPAAKSKAKDSNNKLVKTAYAVLLGAISVLLIATVIFLVFGKGKTTTSSEASNVNTSQFQAVFLNGGQVYFGKISSLNSKYIKLDNIYYLRVNQQVQPGQTNANANDISLVKLGCELHGPEDSMVIYREQVIFWENLKTDGQVAKAVDQYVKANPNGQKCDQQQNTGTSSGNTNSGSTTNGTTRTNSTSGQ